MSPKTSSPSISLSAAKIQQGNLIYIHGKNWPLDAITFKVTGFRNPPITLLSGSRFNGAIVPDVRGEFYALLHTDHMKRGKYKVTVTSESQRNSLVSEITILKRIELRDNEPRSHKNKPYYRLRAFIETRNKSYPWPAGIIGVIRKEMSRRNDRKDSKSPDKGIVYFSEPVPGKNNWLPMGPAPLAIEGSHGPYTGRIKSLAIDPILPTTIYAGSASGGLWKTTDSGATWKSLTDSQISPAIGAIAIDPFNSNVIYVGTGEMTPGQIDNGYYGRGILKSEDAGKTWNLSGGSLFDFTQISKIVIHPEESNNIYVSAGNGLWTSEDAGKSWNQVIAGVFTDVILVQNPSESEQLRLIAGKSGSGLVTLTRTSQGWDAPVDIVIPGVPVGSNNITLGVCRKFPNEIYVAFTNPPEKSDLLQSVARSSDRGTTWTTCNLPSSSVGQIYQASYNLSIQPHPEDPEMVFLAVVEVYKSIDGGKTWQNKSDTNSIHVDTRALTFHPKLPDSLYVGTDGGVYFSSDAGENWKGLMLDMNTMQIFDFGQHPKYDSIIIAGSQDNGGFYYTGCPIWRKDWVKFGVPANSRDGDVVFAQIDPFNPYIHYHGVGGSGESYRSDDGGKLFTGFWKTFPFTRWEIPFYCSPHTPGVVYTGGIEIFRSTNRGDDWTVFWGEFLGPIRAMGFHPTDPLLIFVSTIDGRIYRIKGPAKGEWTYSTVTGDDIVFTGLPDEIEVSSIDVDVDGNIWIAISNFQTAPSTGELTNKHVFRLDAGTSVWINKSNGLSAANPVNTILCDPNDTSIVYCGADWGVFKWKKGAEKWELFDEGLPNVPIVKLKIHGPTRKMRAATYGRGLWERQLDKEFGPSHYLYMRNHIADAGNEPVEDGVDHPFVEGSQCWHWQSPDIIADHIFQTPKIAKDPLVLAQRVEHTGAQRGANRIYVRVHNKGPFRVTNVQVRAFFAPASAGLPDFPEGMIKNPFNFVPSADSEWNPVGNSFPIESIEPGTTRLAYWEFVIPESAPAHSCIMAFTTSSEDSFSEKEGVNPDSLVINNRRVALRNLDLDAIPGTTDLSGETEIGGTKIMPGASWPKIISFNGNTSKKQRCSITITTAKLPEDAYFIVLPEHNAGNSFRSSKVNDTASTEKIKKAFLNSKDHGLDSELYRMNDLIVYPVSHRELVLGEAMLSKTNSMRMAIWIWSKKWNKDMQYSYDVLQWNGKRIVGGYSVEMINGDYLRRKS